MRTLGAILAGGQSRRFGSDKAMADAGGVPLMRRVAAALAPYVDDVVVCGHPAPPGGMVVVPDMPAPGLGPLGGLAGALHYAAGEGYDAVVSVGCDTPALDAAMMRALIEARGAAYIRQSPIIGRWPVALADALAAHVTRDPVRSMRGWAQVAGAVTVDAGSEVVNLNTREDLADWVDRRPVDPPR